MIDPFVQLAFNVHANKGVYALLLGSGISRAAGIPTGWEVVLDLTRRLAALHGEPVTGDVTEWYAQKFGKQSDYSGLLDDLAPTPAERLHVLRSYFEPTADEREQGIKTPTAAHCAIASLVANGYIRAIVTTNFDRLLETALTDAGVAPTVIATPDAVEGALPLVHSTCVVVKIHGDYLDTRLRNTPSELATYDVRLSKLLDRIFDEFGLIVSGWSGEWDVALRDAMTRTPNRRFTTYWAAMGDPRPAALDLIRHRSAAILQIADADSLFRVLLEKVQGLEDLSQPHPLSAELAVSIGKKYLAEERYAIRLHDLVMSEVDRALGALQSHVIPGGGTIGTRLTGAVRACEATMSIVLPLLAHGIYWSNGRHDALWRKALDRLLNHEIEKRGGWDALSLLNYPAALALYTMGLAAVEAEQLPLLRQLFTIVVRRRAQGRKYPVIDVLPPAILAERDLMRNLDGMQRRHAPFNDWMCASLFPHLSPLLADSDSFQQLFDKFEILISLAFSHLTSDSEWLPVGAFAYRNASRQAILGEIEQSLRADGPESPYCRADLFGTNKTECEKSLERLKSFVQKLGWR